MSGFDKKSLDLAEHFLSDEPAMKAEFGAHELAQEIQNAVEAWFDWRRGAPVARVPAGTMGSPPRCRELAGAEAVKVIFLDVDGVLNSMESTLLYKTMNRLCPVRVGMVARLCEEAGARSWCRRRGAARAWRAPKACSEAGAKRSGPFIIGQTPRMLGKRGHEIAAWLKDNPVDAYVILDDDSDMLPGQAFVHTSMARGFCLDSYLDALKLLQPDHHHLSPMSLAAYRGNSLAGRPDLWDDDEKLTAWRLRTQLRRLRRRSCVSADRSGAPYLPGLQAKRARERDASQVTIGEQQ
jgi:hypothetical protein